uniref:Uncharacterized protein n=1 Tax=Geospiza parvula TaxID=87175 RepID=A0A8U8AXI2_GEOPR
MKGAWELSQQDKLAGPVPILLCFHCSRCVSGLAGSVFCPHVSELGQLSAVHGAVFFISATANPPSRRSLLSMATECPCRADPIPASHGEMLRPGEEPSIPTWIQSEPGAAQQPLPPALPEEQLSAALHCQREPRPICSSPGAAEENSPLVQDPCSSSSTAGTAGGLSPHGMGLCHPLTHRGQGLSDSGKGLFVLLHFYFIFIFSLVKNCYTYSHIFLRAF